MNKNIEINPNIVWEQVFYFLNKKDIAIEKKVKYFWEVLFTAFLDAYYKETYLKNIELQIKKNNNNTTFNTLKIEKKIVEIGIDDTKNLHEIVTKIVPVFYWDNEEVTLEYIKELFEIDDIISLQKAMIQYFEDIHLEKTGYLNKLNYNNEHLKLLLNPNKCNKVIINNTGG